MRIGTNNNETVTEDNLQKDDLFPFEEDGKWGFLKIDWQTAIQPIYHEVDLFYEGLAAVSKGDKWGYIDLLGRTVIGFNYSAVGPFLNGQTWVGTGNGFSIIDNKGNVLKSYSDELIDEILLLSSNMYLYQKDERYGYLNDMGIVIEAKYEEASPFCDGIALVTLDGESAYIDTDGHKILSNKEYSPLESFSEGVSLVAYGKDQFAYINNVGDIKISLGKRMGSSFSEGRAFFFDPIKMRYGYIDSLGTEVIPAKYDSALPFLKGLAYVKQGSEVKLIDREGNTKYILPNDTVVDVDSYLLNRDFYLININGDDKIVNRNSGEIRD